MSRSGAQTKTAASGKKQQMRNENADLQYSLRFDFRSTLKASEVKVHQSQAAIFGTIFSLSSDLLGLSNEGHHCVFLVETDRIIPNLTLKSQGQSLTEGQKSG